MTLLHLCQTGVIDTSNLAVPSHPARQLGIINQRSSVLQAQIGGERVTGEQLKRLMTSDSDLKYWVH